jgi:hypothetical protein
MFPGLSEVLGPIMLLRCAPDFDDLGTRERSVKKSVGFALTREIIGDPQDSNWRPRFGALYAVLSKIKQTYDMVV